MAAEGDRAVNKLRVLAKILFPESVTRHQHSVVAGFSFICEKRASGQRADTEHFKKNPDSFWPRAGLAYSRRVRASAFPDFERKPKERQRCSCGWTALQTEVAILPTARRAGYPLPGGTPTVPAPFREWDSGSPC